MQSRVDSFWLRLRSDPRVDPGGVGVSFVDVLFALVVGYALTPLATWWKISEAGWFDLGVAIVLTLTSWIGYHNSHNRPRWIISFPNYPLAIFVLDILMVVTYAFAVFVANSVTTATHAAPTPLPETTTVSASFVLYVLWDYVNLRIKTDPRYRDAWGQAKAKGLVDDDMSPDNRERRVVTWICTAAAAILLAVAIALDATSHTSTAAVCVFDVLLILLLVTFRLAKEFVTPEGHATQAS